MDTLAYKVFPITNLTRQTCFDIRRFPCCGDQFESVENFRLDLFREGLEKDGEKVATYEFFHVDEETGELCVIWDDALDCLCRGRYIGHIYFDCRLVGKVRFFFGSKASVENISFRESRIPDCFSDTIPVQCENLVEPDQCCEEVCVKPPPCCNCVDPCDPCNCLDEPSES